jgi:hypothetical protein
VKKVFLGLLVLVVAGALVVGFQRLLDERRTRSELTTLQNRVYDARVAVDSCRNELAYQEMLFHRFDTLVNSLRGEVDAFEALDERGVPEPEYDAYMRAFEGYNDSVSVWEARADSLRATESVCRMLVERHNELADSFRARLGREGLMETAEPPGPGGSPETNGDGLEEPED